MKRGTLFLAVFLCATLGVSAARAQGPVVFYLGGGQGDTAAGAVPGTETRIPVRDINPWYYYSSNYYTVTNATLTFVYDTAKVEVLGVQPGSSGLVNISSTVSAPGTFTVSATGDAYGPDAEVYGLRVKLKPGVTDGSYLWIKSDSVALCYVSYYCSYYGTYWRPAVSKIGQVCHATEVWGDVDGNFQVDSRDALITLSAAVGLPVSGFNLAQGDVDGDGLTNSRDALIMLSYAIAVPTLSARIGVGVPDACPGLTPPGETVVFTRNLSGSGGIFRLDSAGGAPVQLSTLLTDQGPRLNNAGTMVVFQCDAAGTPLVCRSNADGSNRVTLLATNPPGSSSAGTQPDWSPSGAYILYNTRGGFGVGRMDSTGANQIPVYSSGMFGSSIAWSRNDSIYALSNPSNYGLYAIQIGNPLPAPLDANFGLITYAAPIRWSPDGTVIAAINNVNNVGGILTLPAAGGTSVPALAPAGIRAYDWGPQGVIFSMSDVNGVQSLWMLRGGFGGPVVRLTSPGSGGADDQPSFRRNP